MFSSIVIRTTNYILRFDITYPITVAFCPILTTDGVGVERSHRQRLAGAHKANGGVNTQTHAGITGIPHK